MKKAREHYQIYLEEEKVTGSRLATENLVKRLWDEASELIRIRKCQSPQSKIAAYLEICAKWDAICCLDSNFKRGGLRELMVDKVPIFAKEQIRRALT